MQVIKNKQIVDDNWLRVAEPGEPVGLPTCEIIIPYSYWQSYREELKSRVATLSICINGDDDIESIAGDMDYFQMITLDFPQLKDGRCYSHARLLRERYAYTGELRAVGDVLRDQLFFMKRCGIDSYQVRANTDIEDALKGFTDFSVTYQAAADGALPVYKIR